jgi:hypothetical protein
MGRAHIRLIPFNDLGRTPSHSPMTDSGQAGERTAVRGDAMFRSTNTVRQGEVGKSTCLPRPLVPLGHTLPSMRIPFALMLSAALAIGTSIHAIPASATTLSFTNRTTADGLGSNTAYGVYVVGSTVYAATNGGLAISTNGGATFTNRTTANGLGSNTSNDVYAVGSTVYVGTAIGLAISTNGGTSFANRTTANGLGINTINGVSVFGTDVYAATPVGLAVSTDGGATFTNRTPANIFVRDVYADASTVYAATNGGLAITTDGGATFTNRTTANGLGSNTVNGVHAVGSTVYAATSGGLSISTNGGTSFTNRTTANGLGSNTVNGVYAVGTTVYAATDAGVATSTDGGATFTNYTTANGLASNTVFDVFAVGSTVYAATNAGLAISTIVEGTSNPAQIPPDVHQSVGLPRSGSCADVDDRELNWAGVSSGGWTPSWAQWLNSGAGGAVCNRTLRYLPGPGIWAW